MTANEEPAEITAPADDGEPIASPLEDTAEPVTPNAVTVNESTVNPATATPSGGAPLANLNHAGHMLASDPAVGQHRLALGKLPASLARCERAANAFRRALEEAVELAHGRIDFAAALAINTAARWERHSALALRWLREHGERMDDAQRLSYSREVARASSERDRAVASLKLGAAARNIWEVASVPAA